MECSKNDGRVPVSSATIDAPLIASEHHERLSKSRLTDIHPIGRKQVTGQTLQRCIKAMLPLHPRGQRLKTQRPARRLFLCPPPALRMLEQAKSWKIFKNYSLMEMNNVYKRAVPKAVNSSNVFIFHFFAQRQHSQCCIFSPAD